MPKLDYKVIKHKNTKNWVQTWFGANGPCFNTITSSPPNKKVYIYWGYYIILLVYYNNPSYIYIQITWIRDQSTWKPKDNFRVQCISVKNFSEHHSMFRGIITSFPMLSDWFENYDAILHNVHELFGKLNSHNWQTALLSLHALGNCD